eukprot:GHVS01014207.1.p1 GENE.GHVS01014207.1~~GHVS01014207.1.p1  ORF type:complete len:122 (-),score=26.06 GHVS01014207.1:46-411(-)
MQIYINHTYNYKFTIKNEHVTNLRRELENWKHNKMLFKRYFILAFQGLNRENATRRIGKSQTKAKAYNNKETTTADNEATTTTNNNSKHTSKEKDGKQNKSRLTNINEIIIYKQKDTTPET